MTSEICPLNHQNPCPIVWRDSGVRFIAQQLPPTHQGPTHFSLSFHLGCLHEALLPEEIGLKEKNFSLPSRQERQGKTDASVF
jgi:hypothetical protein